MNAREPDVEQMSVADKIQIAIAIGAVIVLFSFISRMISLDRKQKPLPPPIRLPVSAMRAIGSNPTWRGEPDAPYTLVEFADYQCPPCKSVNRRVETLMQKLPGKLRITFRNYPLNRLHPFAQPAAIAAEVARQQGQFWKVHDALYAHQRELQTSTINKIMEDAGIHDYQVPKIVKSASHTLEQDKQDGDACNVQATPTFVLCCPDGTVFPLTDIDQSVNFVK